jgi:serine/threonine protein kinase/Tol biopolymer transport system component
VALSAGTRLGPYEIVSALGAGGMGEVYRARDPRLGRDVAIKVLPAAFSTDVDRLRRFEQEARAAASLNHPNILGVHDIGTDAGAPFIVSELLEGMTLRDRLNTGPIGVRQALEFALQIAHGLAAAHEKSITHRDLKPENVFVTRDSRVRILDFGLAKLTHDQHTFEAETAIVTAAPPTQPGVVLGTVGYMAPEQVRGLPVDHRADLFALGAILYELLSGRRAFSLDTAAETMTAILRDDPPELNAAAPVPPALVRIVNRCLEKSPSTRFQTASDLAFALESVLDASGAGASPATNGGRPRMSHARLGWAVALLLATLAPLAYQHLRETSVAPSAIRFQIAPTVEFAGPGNFGLSPDGRHLAFVGRGSDGSTRLWIRTMDSLEVRPIPGSETNNTAPPPFWSPDGRFVAFDAGGKLKKVDVSGGLPQTLCELPLGTVAVGGSWNRDGDIIVGNFGGLLHCRETGGAVTSITTLDPSRKEEFHLLPTFLPDGQHFVYLRVSPSAPEASGTYIGTLDAEPEAQSAERLMPYAVGMTYAAAVDSGPGRLLFLREGTLMAQPFDATRLALAGEPVPVAERVGSFRDGAFFSASANGVLVYRNADTDSQLTWFDRQGAVSGLVSQPGGFRGVALSPDGARAVASRTNPLDATKADLWLFDFSRGSAATRLTLGTGLSEFPVWSRDGTRIAFTFNNSSLRHLLASGEGDEEELLRSQSTGALWATSWSPDGRVLLYAGYVASVLSPGNIDLSVIQSSDRKPVPFLRDARRFSEDQGQFSPNGRWVAYVSNESGQSEVYVREFTADFSSGSASIGGSVLVSRGGGTAPRWSGNGREIFYLAPNGKMMAVAVGPGRTFGSKTPTPLFQTPSGTIVGDISADAKRFLLIAPVGPSASAPFTVVLNWTAGLKK